MIIYLTLGSNNQTISLTKLSTFQFLLACISNEFFDSQYNHFVKKCAKPCQRNDSLKKIKKKYS